MPRSIALVSLYPITGVGGGERYTSCTYRSIKAAGDHCLLFARNQGGPETLPLHQRLAEQFTEFTDESLHGRAIAFKDILMKLGTFDVVWVHQFLSSDFIFDLIATTVSTQTFLMTNLGHEPIASRFAAFYCQPKNHYFVEISRYAAQRSLAFGSQSIPMTGAIWQSEFPKSTAWPDLHARKICSVGRVLPHKGIDITIKGLPRDWELNIVGPWGDSEYFAHLQNLARGKQVRFAGAISAKEKLLVVSESLALVASSCHRLYDGREIPQAELLGLVIFEAIVSGTLPVTSDVPSFKEVMTDLGLSSCVYTAGDAQHLSHLLKRISLISHSERRDLILQASTVVRQQYLWDDYWLRVAAAIER